MRRYSVAYSPEAEANLASLYRYIARQASPAVAKRFTEAIMVRCEGLDQMPKRGKPRGDLRPGLRTISFRRRVVIAYSVDDTTVTILGIFYGGQDYEALLRDEGE